MRGTDVRVYSCSLAHSVVDCAEGTSRQFELQPPGGYRAKRGKVTTIFITHMHGEDDHAIRSVGSS